MLDERYNLKPNLDRERAANPSTVVEQDLECPQWPKPKKLHLLNQVYSLFKHLPTRRTS